MLHAFLRENTRQEHAAIESAVNFLEITRSSDAYENLLVKFYGFYSPIEEKLLRFEPDLLNLGLNLRERLKTKVLIHDLELFKNVSSKIKFCSQLPAIENVFQVMGVLYVLEGSTLGGQVIHHHLLEKNDFADKEMLRFHFVYKEQTMDMWEKFKATLSQMPEGHEQEILLAAKNTFTALKDWVCRHD